MPEPDLYRNRDFIPNFDAIMAETETRSREVAARNRMERDIPYGSGPRQNFDLVFPSRDVSDAPLHIFIHGGYWRAGSKDAHTLVAEPVLAVGGICALVGYGLMPSTRLGDIVAQVRAAACHIAALAPQIGADQKRITASGHSAGAHLASLLAAQAPGDTTPPLLPNIKALLLVSGIYDLSGIPDSFLKDEARMTPKEAADWSPLQASHRPGPHRIITHGQNETRPFHDQAKAFAALVNEQGASQGTYRCEPARNHLDIVLDLADPTAPLGQTLADLVAGEESHR
ncbi:alpha/beta hydrolase [Pseudosulfitobacter koreensis]|uniref:Alpha/beta hydrolase n=1 Tax=Pseudosulfitobacter koreensis TaxID=2968472 RepID=A0ABT1Z4Z2_9RHOB|nr:alpha/beta hydrolase [Pseudosulfitobacter koreense]MCR8828207.1 alpha/beta hydrolase [Pseudosulfitobacter koreense]